MADDINVAALAKRTAGYSGADLQELVDTAADLAVEASLESEEDVPICQAFAVEALEEVRSTTSEWLTTARNYARYANESGQYDSHNSGPATSATPSGGSCWNSLGTHCAPTPGSPRRSGAA